MRSLLVATLALVACADAPGPALRPGRSYQATLVVTSRGPILPEVAAHLPKPRDTATASLVVDSARADSTFGHVQLDVHSLGTTGGDPLRRNAPYDFVAQTYDDSVELRLWPGATDQDVWLRGRIRNRSIQGAWETAYSPRLSGVFAIER